MDKIIKILIAAFVIALIYAAIDSFPHGPYRPNYLLPSAKICAGIMILLWGAIVIKKLSDE